MDKPSDMGDGGRLDAQAEVSPPRFYEAFGKRLLDVVLSVTLVVLILPVFALVAFLVAATSRGPVIYIQRRIGKGGAEFPIYKFRTMYVNAESRFQEYLASNSRAREEWSKYQKLASDPRITKIGAILRKTSLDELPQLVNVLVGHMSLVGPRPCMPSQKPYYGAHWSAYCSVRPGITGLWQVSGRSLLSFEARVKLDGQYVRSLSLLHDLRILGRTLFVVFTGR